MEHNLAKSMEEAFSLPGVSGVMCVDNSGLVLGAKGNIDQNSSGSLSALSKQASSLSQNLGSRKPVICLESEAGSILVQRTKDVTTAIYKDT